MYKVKGKQQYGSVWLDGQCAAIFVKGVAAVQDEETARQLAALGYGVDPEPPEKEPNKEPEPTQEPDKGTKTNSKGK